MLLLIFISTTLTASLIVYDDYNSLLEKPLHLFVSIPALHNHDKQVNPATNFQTSNPLASIFANTGLVATFPDFLYNTAQV